MRRTEARAPGERHPDATRAVENLSDRFVADIVALRHTITEPIRHQARRCLLDYLGVTLAGAHLARETGTRILEQLATRDPGVGVVGFSRNASLETAVLLNGMSSHVLELDDGVRFGMLHPGSPILSALLPVATHESVTGDALLTGIVAGYEAATGLASAMQPFHYDSGYHPTATCGTVGAAIGLVTMLGYPAPTVKAALSAAATWASGTLKVIEDGSQLKPFNAARAAVNGLLAANIAHAGVAGADDPLGGPAGFFAMMAPGLDASDINWRSEQGLWIERVYVKPYAACRHAHPTIEAILELRSKHDIPIDAVEHITISTYRTVLGKHDHTEIAGPSSAKMSIPFSAAVALADGRAGLEEFAPSRVDDPALLELTRRVTVRGDEALSKLVPKRRAAIVEIQMNNGDHHSRRVDFPKGEPENPCSDEELVTKFHELATFAQVPSERAEGIVRAVWDLPQGAAALFELLSPTAAASAVPRGPVS
jgi:2-methylcitrate dehydratase PrpD